MPPGPSIEDQINSKGDPPGDTLPISADVGLSHQSSYSTMPSNGLRNQEEFSKVGQKNIGGVHGPTPLNEATLAAVKRWDGEKVVEEEVKSMGSGKSKATVKSTPEDWFKDLNRSVRENNNLLHEDDDPPYQPDVGSSSIRRKHQLGFKHLRPHKLSKLSAASALRGRRGGEGTGTLSGASYVDGNMIPTEIEQMGGVMESTSDSNSDSYRSVIDDLTIKNQKLKRRLRKLEELHAEHLQTDKVFELRIHGLPAGKRQELENLLQQFTASLHKSPQGSTSSAGMKNKPPSARSIFNPSSIDPSDSAYASKIGSGAPSSHPSLSSGKSGDSRGSKGNWSNSNSNSSSSGGLNGKKVPTYISEKAKMKQVVRRLEYLFTRSQDSNLGPSRSPVSSDPDEALGREGISSSPNSTGGSSGKDSGKGISSQTKPATIRASKAFELDPRLAQIPEKNLAYLHNLTSSGGPPINIGGHWDGWVYLNVVMNLAQLHTINVTVAFVKKAIEAMSVKLELSADGKMVRWKGGMDVTNLSSEGENRSETASSPSGSSPMDASSEGSRGRKRSDGSYSQTDMSGQSIPIKEPGSMESSTTRLSTHSRSQSESLTSSLHGSIGFHYKPLFAQSKNFDDDSSEPETTYSSSSAMKSSSSPDGTGAHRAGSGESSGDRSKYRGKKATVGPIIYYENGKFCTDLSTQEIVPQDESASSYPYERMTNEVVGAPGRPSIDLTQDTARPLLKTVSALETVVEGQLLEYHYREDGHESDDEEDYDDDESCGLDFSPRLDSTFSDDPPLPVELEASGIGGVQPEDNFAINVQVKHYLLPKGRSAQTLNSRKLKSKLRGITHRIPQSSIEVFLRDEAGANSGIHPNNCIPDSSCSSPSPPPIDGRPSPEPLRHELVSTRFIRLPPSSLPPASYMFYSPSSDESSRDSDSGMNSRITESDYYADLQLNDGFTDDSQDIQSNENGRSHSRESMEDDIESSSTGSSNGESTSSSRLIVGRQRAPGSSAATAGSIMGDDDLASNEDSLSYQKDMNDSDAIMDDVDGPDDKSIDSDDYQADTLKPSTLVGAI
ncbi:frequency clock protein [Kalaharituber pfeilii]|nr:frequency clock protein [Kalaharituber pfeilii]